MKTVYLDNAATSWPKPETVDAAMKEFHLTAGANPGRSGHRLSIDAGRIVYGVREKIASLFNAEDPLHTVFTKNATEALNIATIGLLHSGDHVIVSGLEHNAVMRPLRFLEKQGVSITVLPVSGSGETDPDDVARAIQKNTKALYCLHGSNVTGRVMRIEELGKISKEHDLIFCVDASQTAGVLPIDMQRMHIDMLAFTGHKGLMGPQGTGGLVLRKGLPEKIRPVLFGGTGSRSEFEEQPDFMPDKFESGTPNTVGIAGLGTGLDFISATGIDVVCGREERLAAMLIDGLQSIDRVLLRGYCSGQQHIAVISFTVDGMTPSDVSFALDDSFGIMTRPGLHCAPAAHKSIGTFPEGTVRMSPGFFTTEEEIEYVLTAMYEITK